MTCVTILSPAGRIVCMNRCNTHWNTLMDAGGGIAGIGTNQLTFSGIFHTILEMLLNQKVPE